jgi:type I restriction-modification system DNA methylase subunit
MTQLENIEAIEKRLWASADTLRANSNYASNEYFLTGFADQKAHDGGEFLTPVSLVQMIVYVIEPNHSVLYQACFLPLKR